MSELFLKILNMSISASWLVLVVLLLRLLLKKAPKWVRVLLWGIVAVRLICPVSIESIFSLIPSAETVSPQIMLDPTPQISTGIEVVDSVVNPVIMGSFAPAALASANPLQLWIPLWAVVWLLGMAAMLVYTGVSYVVLRRKVAAAVLLRDNIYQSENAASPFVLGMVKPKIYLPFQMGDGDMEYVIAHERGHIQRRDHWWKPVGFLLLTVYWFNPLLWPGYILLCRDIELACDEKVIGGLDNVGRADYTQALVTCSVNRRSIAACPLAFGEVGVKERVKSVMHYKKPAFWIVLTAVIACVVVAVCFLTNPPVSVNEKLGVFIDCQIAAHHQNKETQGRASCVNWEVLGTKKSGAETTVYMWVLYEEYSLLNNSLYLETGSHIPTAITVRYEDGTYDLVEYWEPRDGAYLKGDIREKFPLYLQHKALDSQRYIHTQQEENEKMAWTSLMEERERISLVATSGENSVPLIAVTAAADCVDRVYWLTIAPGVDTIEPFRILRNGEEQLGRFNAYDAETMEPLQYVLPSGLSPHTWLFQRADPARKYIVTVRFFNEPEGNLYAFGAEFDSNAPAWGVGIDREVPKKTVDEVVSEAIIARNAGDRFLDVPTGAICVESHYTLDSETRSGTPLTGDNTHAEETTVYVQYVYKRYYYSGGTLEDRAGTATVAAIGLTGNEESGYTVTDFWEPNHGSTLADEIWEKFPKAAAELVLDTHRDSWYVNDLESKCLTKAERYVAEVSGNGSLPVAWIHDLSNQTVTAFRLEFDIPCTNLSVNSQNGLLIDIESADNKAVDEKLDMKEYGAVFWTPPITDDFSGESRLTFGLSNGDEILYEGSITITGRKIADGRYAYVAVLDCDGLAMQANPDNVGAIIRTA